MKLSISNIAWAAEKDDVVYGMMRQMGFQGLEIAPTRIFPESPYERIPEAQAWRRTLPFAVPSMQSIWYGRQENIFASLKEQAALVSYTEKASRFAEKIHCRNLVFGCPQNRRIPAGKDSRTAALFFQRIAEIAETHGCIIGLEANPVIYKTNFLTDTPSVLQFIHDIGSRGLKLNLDVGAMLYNDESVKALRGQVACISHVHISEPGLMPIQKRALHMELAALLKAEGYDGFISIEMARVDDLDLLGRCMEYVREIFA